MGDQPNRSLKERHSFYISQAPKSTRNSNICKSEMNVVCQKEYSLEFNRTRKCDTDAHESISLGEYYKNYEHDEVPVKESDYKHNSITEDKGSLTNSELDKLEMKIFKNMPQELQTESMSMSSLDSNIKFFRTTVLQIFDNFYASMNDFELYKKRFHEILAKNKEDAICDMEEFITDMIQNIMSSETSISNISMRSHDLATLTFKDKETYMSSWDDESSSETNTNHSAGENLQPVIEAYKNDNYLTDSTLEENASKGKCSRKEFLEQRFNIYLLSGSPCVQIKMNDRNLLSEINIKEPFKSTEGKHVASAENMERLAAKKMELEKYVKQEEDFNVPDREIPVRVSSAKKNIYLNEDFSHERDSDKSFISKICNFLCRKFRKTS